MSIYDNRLLRLRLVDWKLLRKLGTCSPVVMAIPPHQICNVDLLPLVPSVVQYTVLYYMYSIK